MPNRDLKVRTHSQSFHKGGFFSESSMKFFQISKSKKKNTILSLKFKFQAQDSLLEYFFFLRFGDLKNESHFLKKTTFRN